MQHHMQLGAVLLGSDFKALAVARSLGERGIPVVVVDDHPRAAWFSRYVNRHFRWHQRMDDAAFVSFLLNIGKQHHLERWVLMPLQDEVVQLVACHRQELMQVYTLITQEWEVVQWANDKRRTYQLAQETGVLYPRTVYPANENELAAINMRFPVIIKPAISVRLQYSARLKAFEARSRAELLLQYRRALHYIPPAEVMVQEIIPGDGTAQYSLAAFCKDGHILASMTARRTRQYPIDYGLGSSFVEAMPVPGLLEPGQKLLSRMRASGMVEIEFKYDRDDHQYKLLDVNLRPWGWHSLCIACGLDFPYLQFSDALGLACEIPCGAASYDYHWVRLLTDILAGWQEVQRGITTPGRYLRSLAGKTVFAVFDWRDPLPSVGDILIAFSRLLRAFAKRPEMETEVEIDDYSIFLRKPDMESLR